MAVDVPDTTKAKAQDYKNGSIGGPEHETTTSLGTSTASDRGPTEQRSDGYNKARHDLGRIENDDNHLGIGTQASVANDGRVEINIRQTSQKLSRLLARAFHKDTKDSRDTPSDSHSSRTPTLKTKVEQGSPPRLNVVIQVVGSRGDVQPFVASGKVLKKNYGHRVRLATHPVFRDFVIENGLEFFSIGGDPAQLMAFMVKNPGLMPGFDAMKSGDVGKRRREIADMVKGCWRSCIEVGDGRQAQASADQSHTPPESDIANNQPFVADAIIANPPSFAHVHCAEKLGCPLHIMFTMPYSPTQAFPHPLANIQSSTADAPMTNFLSYILVDAIMWQGLGDVMNRFRQDELGLEPVSLMWAPGTLARLHIPHTYCWSPALIPKPKDWAEHIAVAGFYFLGQDTEYTPAEDLENFLNAGPAPIYIGFGSIVVDDPVAMTKMIFDAIKQSGQRALVSKGWGGIGGDQPDVPENVFMLGNVPHDWLFKHVSAVVHHGGAGTTAAGITCGKPTVIVPFFGDQPFWGAMVAKAGAGPEPIAYKDLDASKLADQIAFALKDDTLLRAKELSEQIKQEEGTQTGAMTFHQQMNLDRMRCRLLPDRAAVWRLRRTQVRLSALAATVLVQDGHLTFHELKLNRPIEYETETGPYDPVTGGAGALTSTISAIVMGLADLPIETLKALKIHPDKQKRAKKDKENEADDDASTEQIDATLRDNKKVQDVAAVNTKDAASTTPQAQFNLGESLAKVNASGSTTPNSISKTHGKSLSSTLKTHLQSEVKSRLHEMKASPPSPLMTTYDTALGTTKSVARIVEAGIKSPMDFTHSLAKGFHNAPKLYGDETVRKSEPITDLKSGLLAAGKEFGFGFYDGITGLVTQPVHGAKKDGALGFLKGIGKGFGGIVLKPGAAVFGITGYTMKGLYKELQSALGTSVRGKIVAARTVQGYAELADSAEEQRVQIVTRWKELQPQIVKKRNPDEAIVDWQREQRGKIKEVLKERRQRSGTATPDSLHVEEQTHSSTQRSQRDKTIGDTSSRDQELTEAIRASVARTSSGSAHDDANLERAMRASIFAIEGRRGPFAALEPTVDDRTIHRALSHGLQHAQTTTLNAGGDAHDTELVRVISQKLAEHDEYDRESDDSEHEGFHTPGTHAPRTTHISDIMHNTHDTHEAHEASVNAAEPTNDAYEKELQEATRQSIALHERQFKDKNEEEAVMEYIKKQSLLEEEHRRVHDARNAKDDAPE